MNNISEEQSLIPVIYADDYIVVVNKPENVLSVPGRGADKWDCVVHRVQKEYPTARIVHRLDCATSGLMILALDADVHRELSRQFHDREVDKSYEAIVLGNRCQAEGRVEQPLITDWPNRPRQKIDIENGKHALTLYECLESVCISKDLVKSRVKLKPVTGRSHQLRVHMQFLGHPIIGDRLYAQGEALSCSDRLCLHASYLAIKHPHTGEHKEFKNVAPF